LVYIVRMKLIRTLTLSGAAFAASLAIASIGPAARAQAPGAVKAFTDARVIDGTDRAPVANATILVRDGKVTAVGPAASVTVPPGAERVSLAGKTVIPGLINAHGYVGNTRGKDIGRQSVQNTQVELAIGRKGLSAARTNGQPAS